MSDPALHAALESLGSDVAFDIAYHMSWPSGNDPFYLANQAENDARRYYYNVNSTPTMKCDGGACGTSQPAIIAAVNSRLAIPSQVWMELNANVSGTDLELTCNAVATRDMSGNYVIQMVLMDKYDYLPNSPNGQPHHYHAMRDLSPSASGQLFQATALDTVTYSTNFVLNPAWPLDNLDVACFIQDNTTKEVIQAAFISIPLNVPNILLTDFQASDPSGNGDGRVDPGETGELVVTLENQEPFHDAQSVAATLSTLDPLIAVTVASATFPDLPTGSSAANTANPFEFTVDPSFEAHEVTFDVTVTAQPGDFSATYPVTFMVGRPDILLVNDDLAGGYQSFYESTLDSLSRIYDTWNQMQVGYVSQAEMMLYPIIIWYTGSDNLSTLDLNEQPKIESYLNGGGRLFLSSQNAGDLLAGTAFYQEVLHAQHLANTVSATMLYGVPGDPISDNTSLFFVGAGGAGNANSSSSLVPLEPAVGIYTYQSSSDMGALRCEIGNGKLVYMAFAFEAITGAASTTTRPQLLNNILTWLEAAPVIDPGKDFTSLPKSLRLSSISPNPFNPAALVEFDLPIGGIATVNVYDLQGRLVQELVNQILPAGRHNLTWDATLLGSGVYLVCLTSGGQSVISKAVLLK